MASPDIVDGVRFATDLLRMCLPMETVRTDITPKVVARAVLQLASSAKDSKDIRDWFDRKQHYLQLRQRGRSVSWFVRAKGQSQKIGSAIPDPGNPDYRDLKNARQRAGEVFFGMPSKGAPTFSNQSGWTWSELDRQYQDALKQPRKVGRLRPHLSTRFSPEKGVGKRSLEIPAQRPRDQPTGARRPRVAV